MPAPISPGAPTAGPHEQPRSAQFLYERALTLVAMGQNEAAVLALRRATALTPRMGAAWRMLGALLNQAGDVAGAAACAARSGDGAGDARSERPAKGPSAGKIAAAERQLGGMIARLPPQGAARLLRDHLQAAPMDAAALRLLADNFASRNAHAPAGKLLRRALELAPGYEAARYDYAVLLFRQNKAALAIPHLQRLLARDPRDIGHRTLFAACLAMVGDFNRAIEIYQAAVAEEPNDRYLLMSYANALSSAGRRADSIRTYRACLDAAPDAGDAYLALATLTQKLSNAEIGAMRALVARDGAKVSDVIHIHYALGRVLERAADYAASFTQYAAGARLKRAQIAYDADDTTLRVERATQLFTPALLAARAATPASQHAQTDPTPIFIVGVPRSGSTLIEQILASHSDVEATIELPEIGHIAGDLGDLAGRASASPYPECLANLAAGDAAALGADYMERTRIYRQTGKRFFVDKMPGNWMHVGLIHLILPGARIIDARRHPMAACFGAFKKCFGGGGQAFSYDLGELGRYYNDYLRMMRHFESVLPGRIYRVNYENVVLDTQAEIRRLLAHCGLAFEESCLRFWETERAVGTASFDQVRRPIFREGLDQWRHYERWLGSLEDIVQQKAAVLF